MNIKLERVFIVLLFIAAVLACKSMKPVTKQSYNKDDLSFNYLSSWAITEDNIIEESVKVRFVQIEGPDDALLFITRFPIKSDITLERYAEMTNKERAENMKKKLGGTIKVGETVTKETQRQIGSKSLKGILQEFSLRLLGVDVPHRAEFFIVEDKEYKWIISTQTPAEDMKGVQEGYQVIYETLSFAL